MHYTLLNLFLAFISTLVFPQRLIVDQPTTFPDSFYSQYDYTGFAKLTSASQRIQLDNIDYDLLNASIFYATNKQRAAHKLVPVQFYPIFRDAAVTQSTQMVKFDFFAHQNPRNAKLKTLKDRIDSVGGEGKYIYAGENISEYFLLNYKPDQSFLVEREGSRTKFINFQTRQEIESHTYLSFGEAIVNDWMTSPGHRANILNERFTHLGCGSLKSTKTGEFPKAKATQVFGTLR